MSGVSAGTSERSVSVIGGIGGGRGQTTLRRGGSAVGAATGCGGGGSGGGGAGSGAGATDSIGTIAGAGVSTASVTSLRNVANVDSGASAISGAGGGAG